jgi:peptidylprolyl isomerase
VKKNEYRLGRLTTAALVTVLAIALAACQPATPFPKINSTATPAPAATAEPSATAASADTPTTIPVTPTPIVLAGATTTASGLQILETVPGTGAAPQPGEIISMNYSASLPNGTELANTFTTNKPVTIVWGRKNLVPGWEEGIGLMKVGSKAKMVIPADLAYGATGNGAIPPNSPLIVEVELLSAKPAPVPVTIAPDKFTKTSSGLQYYDMSKGDGAEAVKNGTVTTDYSVWVKTDTGYDYVASSAQGGAPIDFVVGRRDKIFPGWDEGVTGMKVGGKRQLIIPPELAFGAQGAQQIPANATLVMEIGLTSATEPQVPTKVDAKDYTTTPSGLKYFDIKPGTGATPKNGDTVVVQYTGWLQDGTQFDSSIGRAQPFSFQIGKGSVIPGWEEGISTMKVGGKRQLVIPPNLAYGDAGSGSVIPPGATLIFDVELVSAQP